jgi:alpha-1,3-rhamnosyl/mannosyltransferase
LTTIEHGIDVQLFAAPAVLSPEVAGRLPDRFALYLGNIEPRKNLVPLITAFALPELRALDLKLVVAGKPAWNADESLAAMDSSPDIVRLGFVSDEDRRALMQTATLFTFPSLYEGFGFPVLEALAAGGVVVTSDRGSLAEVAGPSLRFPSLDPEGIAAGIVTAASDDAARAACLSEGREWASRFTWDTSVDKHIEVYERIAR